MLEAKNLSVTIELSNGKKLDVLKDISLSVNKGEFVSIVGPSGSGKTTLLYSLSSFLTPTNGSVKILGQNPYLLKPNQIANFRRQHIGFIFQQLELIPALNAYDNILLPATLNGKKISEVEINAVAESLKLEANLKQSISALSGGEQQKVAIARTLLADPEILFLDEPTSALDTYSRILVMDILRRLVEREKTVVMVTHDLQLAEQTHRSVILKDGCLDKIIGNHNHNDN